VHGVGLPYQHSQRSRDLSDEEIRPALTLRHQRNSASRTASTADGCLRARGRVFKTDPIAINPNMTGSEFASAVRTLPAAERRLIEAKLREMARKGHDEALPPIA
jgi:hypothetical protein